MKKYFVIASLFSYGLFIISEDLSSIEYSKKNLKEGINLFDTLDEANDVIDRYEIHGTLNFDTFRVKEIDDSEKVETIKDIFKEFETLGYKPYIQNIRNHIVFHKDNIFLRVHKDGIEKFQSTRVAGDEPRMVNIKELDLINRIYKIWKES